MAPPPSPTFEEPVLGVEIPAEIERGPDQLRFADGAVAHQFGQLQRLRMAAVHVGLHQQHAPLARGGEDTPGVGQIECERLFAKDVFARLGRLDGPLRMQTGAACRCKRPGPPDPPAARHSCCAPGRRRSPRANFSASASWRAPTATSRPVRDCLRSVANFRAIQPVLMMPQLSFAAMERRVFSGLGVITAGVSPAVVAFPPHGAKPAKARPKRSQKGIVNTASAVVPSTICTATNGCPP